PFTDYANISFAITGDDSGELSGLTSGKTYALSGNSLVNGSTDVIADSNGKAAVSNITVGTLTVSSEWTTVLGSVLSISKLSSPTGVGKVDCSDSSTNDGQLTGVSTDMEYKKSTDTSWTPCTATTVTGLAAGDYYVRMKHTTTQLASDYVTLSISAPSTTPTPPPTTPYVPSYDPPAPEPRINGGAGWNSISDSITKTEDGGTINIDMNGTTNFPGKVINTLQGKDVNVVLDMGNGIKWTINGKNITNPIGDINMGVSIGSSLIPVDVINNLTGDRYSMQIKLAHNGPFGFSATLTIPMRVQDAGLFANLFRYVKNKNVKAARAAADVTYDSTDSGTMEFMGVGKIADDGSVDLLFDGAPDSEKGSAESAYAIVVDDHSLDPSIVPEPEPEVLTLKSTSKKGKVALSWNKLTGAKKYRIYQKIGKKYKMLTELKKKKFTVKKAYKKVKVKIKKKEKTTLELKKLTAGKEYTFVVKAFVDGKWTKVTKQATKKVKVKK
ncbi:MAG: hypothetical protein VZQ83_07780, partial [Eubacterium sp.]|nr:hypothetical protein [Eubacterium sp.]